MDNRDELIDLYWQAQPKRSFQGLPPETHEKTVEWVSSLMDCNFNLIAFHDDHIVGHATLIEVKPNEVCEYLISVREEFRNGGVGTKLTELAKKCARENGFTKIWLSVDLYNARAIHIYKKIGFKFISPMEAEREMLLDLD